MSAPDLKVSEYTTKETKSLWWVLVINGSKTTGATKTVKADTMDGQSFFLSGCDVLIIFHKSTGQSFRINSFYLKNVKKEGKNKENIL